MEKKLLLLLVLALVMSCEKPDNTCNCDNPLEDLQWLKDLKSSFTDCTCQISIIQATYNKETVFYVALTDIHCYGNYAYVLKDCNGDTVKIYDPTSNGNFSDEVTDRRTIYTCKE
jgi:hypothetical protein